MDTQTIAIICAGIGVVGTVVYLLLVRRGANSVRDISDAMRGRPRRDKQRHH